MCAVREPAPVEHGADSPRDQQEFARLTRWTTLLRGFRRLCLRRRLWGLVGNYLKNLAATERNNALRRWWGSYGNVLRDIKDRGRVAVRDLPAARIATRSVEPDAEPEVEPASSSQGSSSTVVNLNINVNVRNHAVPTGSRSAGEGRRRGRGRGR